jgi:hypothetical protein
MTTTVYQIIKLPDDPDEQPIIIAMTSKKSAKRIIAALAEQGELDRAEYRVTRFSHPELELNEKGPLEC